MSEHSWFLVAIAIYLVMMLYIGWAGFRRTTEYDDYVLGGRGLHPFVAALSAAASDMSGWLLMGLPGAIYLSGLNQLWIAIGLFVGATANWLLTAPRLRSYSHVARNSLTVPTFFEARVRDNSHLIRVASGIIILLFFTFYVSSGMVAGGLYWQSVFDGSYLTGMLIVAGVTVVYTLLGGFLAVSNTDTVQGSIMFVSLLVVPTVAVISLLTNQGLSLGEIFSFPADSPYPGSEGVVASGWFNMTEGMTTLGIIGLLAWGLGYFGQPHVIVRFMALRKPSEARKGMLYGAVWQFVCLTAAVIVALIATSFFASTGASVVDTNSYETIFLDMARFLMHPLIAGLVLTAVLAAIMSTISSQLLVSSTALVEDLYRGLTNNQMSSKVSMTLSRIAVLIVAVIAALLARDPENSILDLVGFAWAGFGSAFGPIMLASLYWRRLNAPGAAAGMITGAVVSFLWGRSELADVVYEILPGVAAATIVMVVVTLLTKKPSEDITAEFDRAAAEAKL
ncbi:sodium/proline symporter PutP [Corynebacterium sp. TAE3-ERU12]|uniref:sodium/proline symporter PutP n=1 Tax=Corynebacterium sp. TAE3-ERU12 TaxID=2849491 RepID=UPI001C479492|nr:sodium/proline symporter PutP [Corynebacterium sp. TAE3-ERU12]